MCVVEVMWLLTKLVVCRSGQGNRMINYNPIKPTGKSHFSRYKVCCSIPWIALNNKLECNKSDIMDRKSGIVRLQEAKSFVKSLIKFQRFVSMSWRCQDLYLVRIVL